MKDDVNVGREADLENAAFLNLYIRIQVLRRSEIAIVDDYDIVVLSEVIGEIRADESGTTRDENAFSIYTESRFDSG